MESILIADRKEITSSSLLRYLETHQMRSTEECGGRIKGGKTKRTGAVTTEMENLTKRGAGFNRTSVCAKLIRLSNSHAVWSQWHVFECSPGEEIFKLALDELLEVGVRCIQAMDLCMKTVCPAHGREVSAAKAQEASHAAPKVRTGNSVASTAIAMSFQ